MIDHKKLPKWIPGKILSASDGLGWNGVSYRQYDYEATSVEVPPMSEFLIIEYIGGGTHLKRKATGQWREDECVPGDLTLLTRSQASTWQWSSRVRVRHAYITKSFLSRVADEVLDRPVEQIDVEDILKTQNQAVSSCMTALSEEAKQPVLGGQLFAETVGTQLAIQLLRSYANINFRKKKDVAVFGPASRRLVSNFIQDQLSETPTLDQLATLVGTSRWCFSQRFKATFNMSIPQYVFNQRIENARNLLEKTDLPLKDIAQDCGFSDQAHMSRGFKKVLGVTPSAYRSLRCAALSKQTAVEAICRSV